MTSLTDTQVVTASGGLVELGYAEVSSTHNITSTSSSNTTPFIGPVTVVSDGSPLLIEFQSPASSVGSTQTLYINLVVDGAVTGLIAQSYDASGQQNVPIRVSRRVTLSAGSHTIALSAWASSSSGTSIQAGAGGVGAFHQMQLRVSKIVEATQWPAVTTGTIICTSSTRPASPFEGQVIYETDTGLTRYYDGTAWEDTAAATRPRHAEVYLASNISYPRATNLQWTHLREDNTGGAWAASPNPERLVFPADGMYLCVAAMRWDVGSGNDSTQTSMSVVGGLGTVTNVGYAVNGTQVSEILTTVAVVSAGDYLQVGCFNKPGGGSPFTCIAGSFMSFTQLSAVPT